ncbi:MAG: hypothetical protein Kow0042_24020 [Calditrichia bacterium]
MKGLIIDCEIPYFATFRKPSSTSLILTYPIPPFTTVRGMIANALGLLQHDHSLQEQIKIGIRVTHPGYKNVEMAKILKIKESPGGPIRNYPSSPMFREYLVNPQYQFFIGGREEIMLSIQTALILPKRPLYLGQSDDLVIYEISKLLDIQEKELDTFDTAVEGIHTGCIVEKVPFAFSESKGKYSLEYKLISIPSRGQPIAARKVGHIFNNLNVYLF